MQREAYEQMAAAEERHWWFRGRRSVIERTFRHLALPPASRILDAGCGSGGNLALLSTLGEVYGFELDPVALSIAEARGVGLVAPGSLPGAIPFAGIRFQAIGLFDVLEHLPEPVASLAALADRLAPGGRLVLTVPAYQWLWGPHDELHGHQRRYTVTTLERHVREAGLRVAYCSYMNTLLFPLAVAQRLAERVRGTSGRALNPAALGNGLLFRVWELERGWIPTRRAPFGLSILAVLQR